MYQLRPTSDKTTESLPLANRLIYILTKNITNVKFFSLSPVVGVNEERPAIPVSNNVGCSSYLKHVKECSKNKAEHDHFGILYTQLQFLMFNNNPFGQHKESCLPS